MTIVWALLTRVVNLKSSTIVIASTTSRKNSVHSRVLIVWCRFSFLFIEWYFKICNFLILLLFTLWNKDLQLERLCRFALEWGIKYFVKSIETILTLIHRHSSHFKESFLIKFFFNLACLSRSPDNGNSDCINTELLCKHKVLLKGLKSKVINVSFNFLKCLLIRPQSARAGHCILLSQLIVWKYDTLEDVAMDEM